MRFLFVLIVLCFALPVQAENSHERAAAKKILGDLQARSIRDNREYCGLLLRLPDGRLISSKAFRGGKARCSVRRIPDVGTVVASYHTHGAYLPGYDNEVPSILDLQVEMEWGIDGYVSTPGGRFWLVDGRRGTIRMLCGPGCLPSDPDFRDQSRTFGKVQSDYSFEALIRRTVRGASAR